VYAVNLKHDHRKDRMSKANAPQVAKLLREYAQRTALRGGNPYYRAKAYSRAADSLAALAEPLDRLVEEERLTEIPGVGEAIADIITKLHGTGTHPVSRNSASNSPTACLFPGPAVLIFPSLVKVSNIRSSCSKLSA
jgi:DNA polymerase/3'-5' exonuclease PolX